MMNNLINKTMNNSIHNIMNNNVQNQQFPYGLRFLLIHIHNNSKDVGLQEPLVFLLSLKQLLLEVLLVQLIGLQVGLIGIVA